MPHMRSNCWPIEGRSIFVLVVSESSSQLLLFLRLHSWQLNHQQPGEIIPTDLGIILLGAHEIGL
jgi:hypothetical protein